MLRLSNLTFPLAITILSRDVQIHELLYFYGGIFIKLCFKVTPRQTRWGAMRDSWEEGMRSWVTPASGPPVTYFQLFYFFSQLSLQNKCTVLTPRLNSSEKLTLNPNPVSKQLIQHKSGQRRAERHGTFLHPRDSNSYANSDFYFRDSAGLCLLSTQTHLM